MTEQITIDGGIVTKSTTTSAHGITVHREQIGRYRFFVSHTDLDGFEHLLWDGGSYDLAIVAADRAQCALGINAPIVDFVGGRTT
jgi:hypothetical protein